MGLIELLNRNKIEGHYVQRFREVESLNYKLAIVFGLSPKNQMKWIDFSKRDKSKDISLLQKGGMANLSTLKEDLKRVKEVLSYADHNALVAPQDWDVMNATKNALEYSLSLLTLTKKK